MAVQKDYYNFAKSASSFTDAEAEQFYKILFALLDSMCLLSRKLRRAIIQHSQIEFFKKNEIILPIGKINKYCYFSLTGIVRAYYLKTLKREIREIASWILRERAIIVSVQSFHDQKPSIEEIQALEDTVCISISYEKLQWIYDNFPEFNLHGRKFKEIYHKMDNERVHSLIMKETATQRYHKLMEANPDFAQRLPLKVIASFLGITPQSLSRIRAKKN